MPYQVEMNAAFHAVNMLVTSVVTRGEGKGLRQNSLTSLPYFYICCCNCIWPMQLKQSLPILSGVGDGRRRQFWLLWHLVSKGFHAFGC